LPQLSNVALADTAPLDGIIGQLELLEIRYGIVLLPMTAPSLKRFEIYHPADPYPAERVFDVALPALEDLQCYGFRFDRSFVDRYPKLRELSINTRAFEPGWFEHLVRSPMLLRLDKLAISIIGDDELRLIAQERDRFARMTRLDLTVNYFSPQARADVNGRLPACLRYR